MSAVKLDVFHLLKAIKERNPIIHHVTNWVTIYDCANIIKVLGASPVMAHAPEEVADMATLASALVLNIGTLTVDLVESMKVAARIANERGIPVILDACGVGSTRLRDQKCLELLEEVRIDLIKGNASEVARLNGVPVTTRGVDAAQVFLDLLPVAQELARARRCTVVITGAEDLVADAGAVYRINNGDPLMGQVVGTGCMATSMIGAFAAVEPDLAKAAASALACFGVAAECAVKGCLGPGTFKECLYDYLYHLDRKTLNRMQKVEWCAATISSPMTA